jgi:hypothetical protein
MAKTTSFSIWAEDDQGAVFMVKEYVGKAIDGIEQVSAEVATGAYGRVVVDIWAVPKPK